MQNARGKIPGWAGRFCSGSRKLEAGDLGFEAAEVGVKVLANLVGEIDVGAVGEAHLGGADSPVPAYGLDSGGSCAGRGWWACKFQADVALLHHAGFAEQAQAACHEDRFGIAMAERLDAAEPAGEDRRDAFEWQLGVNPENVLGLAGCEFFCRVGDEATAKLGQALGGQREARGECVAAETGEKTGAGGGIVRFVIRKCRILEFAVCKFERLK